MRSQQFRELVRGTDRRLRAASSRMRNPSFLPRPELQRTRIGGLLLIPSAAYHVDEVAPLAGELRRLGHPVTVMTTRVAPNSVAQRMRQLMGSEPLFAWPRSFRLLPSFDGLLVFNDWGPTQRLIELAKARAIPTFGKVEGVQDFFDADTGRDRAPYRRVDIVLAQGENDRSALSASRVVVVGNSRLEAIWNAPPRMVWNDPPIAVINSNFTYGVLAEQRDRWLRLAIRAAEESGCRWVVSQHPADPPLPDGLRGSPTPMHLLLEHTADVLISRFSTVPFEAMARGVPFVYFNPHGETVPTFTTATDAFPSVADPRDLSAALTEALTWRGGYRDRAEHFFFAQISLADQSSASRAAQAIHGVLEDADQAHRS